MLIGRLTLSAITATFMAVASLAAPSYADTESVRKTHRKTVSQAATESFEFPGFHGHVQKHSNWCYAAVSQSVQAAFGANVSQEQVAHSMVYHFGESFKDSKRGLTSIEKRMVAYYRHVQDMAGDGIDLEDWETVKGHVSKRKDMLRTLHGTSGNPNVDGRSWEGDGGPVTNEQIVDTIKRPGLIIALRAGRGDAGAHFTIIHGYRYVKGWRGKESLQVKVWDPLTGSTQYKDADEFRKSIRQTYRIIG